MTKLLDRKAHALSDYGFTLGQWVLPEIIGMNKQAVNLYRMLGSNLLAYNMLTDQPLAFKKVIPYRTHYLIDVGNVGLLALLTFHQSIRRDKRALGFHLGLVALAALNILMTNWKAKSS
jgi:hypothetical protein